ncbi:MAG TPA: hypothetical protein VE445_04240 [Nitrososphaeraceae archaeon]|jgi:hypothetical protein|nr:hypothetical protein [Nitrososphaeraceae archaeon]
MLRIACLIDSIAIKIVCTLFLGVFSLLALTEHLALEVSAQHHGAPPPLASIGDRKVSLNFETNPNPIIIGQDISMKIAFLDENAKKNVNHVTFRMDISKDGKHFLSEFFHSHEGEVNLLFRDTTSGATSSSDTYSVGASSDILTNAWIADPGSPITVRGGGIFSQPGTYKTLVELTTMDNDKTDLPQPIPYEFNISVS